MEEYVARVLAKICESALHYQNCPNAIFVNYNQFPQFATSTLLNHFQIDYSVEDIAIMNSAVRFDAKSSTIEFVNDAAQKQSEADNTLRLLSKKMLPLYEELEAVRGNYG